jgi:hypothetical protein
MDAGKLLIGSVLLIVCSGSIMAETYKCTQNGKTVISDAPCAHNASRVDQQHDKVERSQQRQADAERRLAQDKATLRRIEAENTRRSYY